MADAKSVWLEKYMELEVGMELNKWFQVNVGLRQGCVMSPWLFNVYIYGVVREVNVRVLLKGLEMLI